MARRKVQTATPIPKALACGMLEDNGRVLFLIRKVAGASETNKEEQIELPYVLVPSGRSPFAEIKEQFQKLAGIDGEVGEIVLEGRYNTGSRKRKFWVTCLVFRITARNRIAKPSEEFSGFRWLSLEDARAQKQYRLGKSVRWLLIR